LWYQSGRRARHSTVSETFKRGEVGYSVWIRAGEGIQNSLLIHQDVISTAMEIEEAVRGVSLGTVYLVL
jgi:hypothetical protein